MACASSAGASWGTTPATGGGLAHLAIGSTTPRGHSVRPACREHRRGPLVHQQAGNPGPDRNVVQRAPTDAGRAIHQPPKMCRKTRVVAVIPTASDELPGIVDAPDHLLF